MRIRCSQRAESAMTLVEVIMPIFVLGIMAGGILGSFRYGHFVMQLARENERATQVMLEKIETIRLYNWTQITSNGFIPRTFTDVYDPQGTNGTHKCTYYGTVIGPTNVTFNPPPSSSYHTNMRQITLRVQWTTRNMPHTRSITTYIAKPIIPVQVAVY